MNSDEHIDNPCNRERYYKFIDDIMDENVCKGKSDSERIKDYARKLNYDYNTLEHKRLVKISRCLNNGIGNVRQLFEFLATSIIATFALLISVMTLLVEMIKKNDACCVCSQTTDYSLQNSDCLIDVLIVLFLLFVVVAAALYIRKCYKRINKYEQIGLNTVYFEVAALLDKDKKKKESEPEDNENG